MGLRVNMRIGSSPNPPNVLTSADLTYLGAIRMPSSFDTSFANGGMTGRKVGGHLHLMVYGNSVAAVPNPPDLLEMDVDGITPVVPPSQTNMTGVPRAVAYKNWGNIYHGKRLGWNGSSYTEITGLQGINHALYYHEGLDQLFWTYDYNYTDFARTTVGFSTLDNVVTGASTAYGPCQYQGSGNSGPLTIGARAHFILKHPDTGKMLMGGVIKSGAAALSYGPSLFGDPDFPTPATSDCGSSPVTIDQDSRYLNYYVPTVANNGSWTGDLTSFRYDGTLTYPYEYFPGTNVDNRVDPTKNNAIGSWSDVDSCANGVWLQLTHKKGVLFFGTLMGSPVSDPTSASATHEYYSNNGQWSMYTSSTTGFQVGEEIRGSTSKARGTISGIDAGVGLGGSQATGNFTIGEVVTGATSGATGTVSTSFVDTSATVTLEFSVSSGTFTVGEIATGGTSNRFIKVTNWVSGTKTLTGTETPDFTDGETVTGQTSSATATITGAPAGIRGSFLRHSLVCTHGQTLPIAVTGPGTTRSTPVIMVYDPDALEAVKAGATDWETNATEIVDLESAFSLITAPQTDLAAKNIDGYYFDEATNRLYLIAIHADCGATGNCSTFSESLIHVFSVSDTP